jgi:hypothetical protein
LNKILVVLNGRTDDGSELLFSLHGHVGVSKVSRGARRRVRVGIKNAEPEPEPEPEARGYTIFVDLKALTNVFEIDLVEAFEEELIASGEGNDNAILERCKNKEEREEIRIKFKEHVTLGVATKMVNVDDDEVAKLGEEGK